MKQDCKTWTRRCLRKKKRVSLGQIYSFPGNRAQRWCLKKKKNGWKGLKPIFKVPSAVIHGQILGLSSAGKKQNTDPQVVRFCSGQLFGWAIVGP